VRVLSMTLQWMIVTTMSIRRLSNGIGVLRGRGEALAAVSATKGTFVSARQRVLKKVSRRDAKLAFGSSEPVSKARRNAQ
jgi:hypothetical protein